MVDNQLSNVVHFVNGTFGRPALFLCILVSAILLNHYVFQKRVRRIPAIPIVGFSHGSKLKDARSRFYTDAQSMLLEGYRKFKDTPFYVPTPIGERLMIPSQYVEELKGAPMKDVDFVATFFEMFEGKYTTMGSRSQLHPRVTRLQLNKYMDTILPPVRDEIIKTFEAQVDVGKDWVEIPLNEKITWIVARASSRMFGSEALANNTEWLDATQGFAMDGFVGAQKIKQFPEFMRPLAAPFIPELRRIPKYHEAVRKAVQSILDARGYDPEKPLGQKTTTTSVDFLQWMIDDAQPGEESPIFLAEILLKISFAALHTSAASPMQLVCDLCEHPEYIQPLRDEVEQVMRQHSTLDKHALGKMIKLDSFMKESLRFNPLLLVTFQRIITKDLTLSDGFRIPSGTFIGSPSQALSMNAELYPDPEKFDAWRHVKMLQKAENNPAAAGRTKFASANLDNMVFGYGRHACPGRWFADYEIKLIMSHLLMTYDFEFCEDQKFRPQNLNTEIQMIPNRDVKIRMRRRNV